MMRNSITNRLGFSNDGSVTLVLLKEMIDKFIIEKTNAINTNAESWEDIFIPLPKAKTVNNKRLLYNFDFNTINNEILVLHFFLP